MVNHVVAEAVGTTERIVAAKRKAFGHPRGTVGRRPKSVVWRKIEVKDVDFNMTDSSNAARLGCSAERIRQLRKIHAK